VRLLLDTHVILWQLSGDRDLSIAATTAIRDADALLVSAVSFAEMGVKAAVGKLEVPGDIVDQVLRAGVRYLGLSPEHGLAVGGLPMHHRDPFDRLLVAQAQIEGLTIVTGDERIGRYDVETISAS